MKEISTIIALFLSLQSLIAQQWQIEEKQNMPQKIANNSVVEALINGKAYVYSFGGIDSTKIYSGITNNSFKYNVANDSWDTVPSLPDTSTKIASAASFVNGIIYIIGGYSVEANGNEISSNKVHRFDPAADTFLTDGTDIPIAIDDQVQAVYKDSLIFVVTGWSNTRNVANVQIYDTYLDSWSTGTSVPASSYQVFGSTGTILGDTLYYYGGAAFVANFRASSQLRKGYIDPTDPTSISWESFVPSRFETAYRPACTSVDSTVIWIGGSEVSYNFDGIAYNGSGGVDIANRIISYNTVADSFYTYLPINDSIPMDLRGVASISDSVKFIAGGMLGDQEVTNKTFRLEYKLVTSLDEKQSVDPEASVYPNPFSEQLVIENIGDVKVYQIYNGLGQLVHQIEQNNGAGKIRISTSGWEKGVYYFRAVGSGPRNGFKLLKQ